MLVAAGILAAVAWLWAVVTGLRLLRHRTVPLRRLAVSGIAWLDRASFRPEAQGLLRHFLLAFALFLACILIVALVAVVTAPSCRADLPDRCGNLSGT